MVALAGQHRTLPGGRTYWLSGTPAGPVRRLVIGIPGSNLPASNINAAAWDTGDPATSGWQKHAAARGYALALLEPGGSSWNVGAGWPSGPQDDMAYAAAVVADAESVLGPFDERDVAGFSAGGALAWRLAAQRPDLFAACGVASGWVAVTPAVPMHCWWTHGGADTTVPVRGGYVRTFDFTFPPQYLASSTVPAGSRVVSEFIPSMGHAMPGWEAQRWLDSWTGAI